MRFLGVGQSCPESDLRQYSEPQGGRDSGNAIVQEVVLVPQYLVHPFLVREFSKGYMLMQNKNPMP